MESSQLLKYLHEGIENLLEQGGFDNGFSFKPTQKEALEAYQRFLNSDLSDEEKLKGFFSIPTGVGKTAIFIGIVTAAHEAAERDGQVLKTAIVVPTTQLLTQTLDAMQGNGLPENHEDYFVGFAPQTKGKIGLYGDGKKNLNLPITIMTYEAWFDLSEKGLIGSDNIDILISDEAHRGTSERRVEKMLGVFDSRTLQIAFTATAHFDDEKSVENSHEREIFHKPMRESVQGGELASYIQSQRAVIRVEPTEQMLSDEFKDATEGQQIKYRRRLKQKTWNEFALKTFREGTDQRTGDLLSDNAAGFFVDGTWQADDLADMLNNDPVLQERAKAQGKKGVAVAIHTKDISAKEQRRRFDAYLAGEYMAVVGDEKFKEGFDYAPMKTLFDYHRNSLVDKVQILGRGARKWWNELKERFEGLTVIDTAIYIGDEDPDIDAAERDKALRYSISVKDVLEDTVVLGPEEDLFDALDDSRKGGSGYSGGGANIFDDDPNIEYITDLEEIYELDSNISKLRREDIIPISDEMHRELLTLLDQKGVGSSHGISMDEFVESEGIPKSLTAGMISTWKARAALSGSQDHWGAVINELKSLSDIGVVIRITDDMREKVRSEISRTAYGVDRLSKHADIQSDVSMSTIKGWQSLTEGKRSETVLKAQWDNVMQVLSGLPDAPARIEITTTMLEQLNAEIDRTGAKARLLVENTEDALPDGLNEQTIGRVASGEQKSMPPNDWGWIIDAYKNLDLIKVTAEHKRKIQSEKVRTGLGAAAIFKEIQGLPEGFAYKICRGLVELRTSVVKKPYLQLLLDTYKDQPNLSMGLSQSDEIEISDADRKKLKSEKERTGLGGIALFGKIDSPPQGLDKDVAAHLVNGNRKFVYPEILRVMLATYAEQPDGKYKPKKATPLKEGEVLLSDADKTKLTEEKERTGLSGTEIFKRISNPPEGLTVNVARQIIRGKPKKVRSAHLDTIFNVYSGLPDKVSKSPQSDPEP